MDNHRGTQAEMIIAQGDFVRTRAFHGILATFRRKSERPPLPKPATPPPAD